MPAVRRTLLLVNPNARHGETGVAELVGQLKRGGPVIAPECGDPDAMKRAIARYAPSIRQIVIGGGDGTLNASLTSVLSAGLPLGVLPLGTANDFARSLGIGDLSTAVDVILAGRTREVDVGMVNEHHFLNAVGIGLGPRINRELDSRTKEKFGVLGYLLRALRNAREYRGMHAVIECDGHPVSVRSIQITIGNGIHYGGGMTISGDARLDDGILRVLSIRPQSLLSLLSYGPAMRTGEIEDDENIQTFAGRIVIVRTRRASDVTADGEAVTHTPAECRSMRRVLRVFAPAPATGEET